MVGAADVVQLAVQLCNPVRLVPAPQVGFGALGDVEVVRDVPVSGPLGRIPSASRAAAY